MPTLSWDEIKQIRPNPPRRLTPQQCKDALTAKAAARLDRARRRVLRKLRGDYAGSYLLFPDGCAEEYDRRGFLVAGTFGGPHDPAAHAGIVTPASVEVAS